MDLLNTDFASSSSSAPTDSSNDDKANSRSTADALRSFYLSTIVSTGSTETLAVPGKNVHDVTIEYENQEGKGGKLESLWGNTYVLSERTTKNYSR